MKASNQAGESFGDEEYSIELGISENRLVDHENSGMLQRVVRRVAFSTRFQYFVCFLAMLYLTLSIGVFAIDFSLRESRKESIGQMIIQLVLLEFAFNTMFLFEIFVRIIGTGFVKYFSSIMNVLDILVVLVCGMLEFECLHTGNPHLSGFASLLFPFRLWYVIRIIDQKNKARFLREVRKLNKKDDELKDKESEMLRAREENNQVENDLAYMLELIRKINQLKREEEEKNMRENRFSWLTFVPQELQLKVKRNPLRRSVYGLPAHSRLKRWSTLSELDSEPKLTSKAKRASTSIL
ncbi:hypothetical protein DSO57_1006728 [Entomophthora muscae]|uniref:Uncharacterized protein n=1 Tax=Entomophthora muscae TaxID=34485 RepID=A0ACC2UU59_9FUNG|nr:hypothetical protein DSO57_1006728 [Entomophthora muscae]